MGDAKIAYLICVFVTGAACVLDFIGTGKWETNSMVTCQDGVDYPIQADLKRRKLNRTHDGFNLTVTVPEEITETSHGIYLEVCKKLDGGCKTLFIMEEDSFCKFVKKFTHDNFVKVMTAAGIDPPDCPIRAGELTVMNYVFDYSELPARGMYGAYTALFYFVKGEERLACLVLQVAFKRD